LYVVCSAIESINHSLPRLHDWLHASTINI
jgi:hypothetical protein